jgi:hypothetical protein
MALRTEYALILS